MTAIILGAALAAGWIIAWRRRNAGFCAAIILVTLVWGLWFAAVSPGLIGRNAAEKRPGHLITPDYRDGYIAAAAVASIIQPHIVLPLLLLGAFCFTAVRQTGAAFGKHWLTESSATKTKDGG